MSSRCAISGVHCVGLSTGGLGELEVQRTVVVQDQQPVGPVGQGLVLDAILDAGPARRDDGELARRVRRVQQPDLAA